MNKKKENTENSTKAKKAAKKVFQKFIIETFRVRKYGIRSRLKKYVCRIIHIMQHICHLLLGSNLGDRLKNLQKAIDYITIDAGTISTKSSIYKTSAWGKQDQPDFYNQVLIMESLLEPFSLLEKLLAIEQKMGRSRKEKWGERVIDIDILYVDDQILDTPTVQLPHPRIQERKFTLIPLAEIAPDKIHPILLKNSVELLADCSDDLSVERL
jgi:2-amino-4-hydroxy-6-hydroxymethyldihydropteridine diphosphokinase